jgi:hypothetical protein
MTINSKRQLIAMLDAINAIHGRICIKWEGSFGFVTKVAANLIDTTSHILGAIVTDP